MIQSCKYFHFPDNLFPSRCVFELRFAVLFYSYFLARLAVDTVVDCAIGSLAQHFANLVVGNVRGVWGCEFSQRLVVWAFPTFLYALSGSRCCGRPVLVRRKKAGICIRRIRPCPQLHSQQVLLARSQLKHLCVSSGQIRL